MIYPSHILDPVIPRGVDLPNISISGILLLASFSLLFNSFSMLPHSSVTPGTSSHLTLLTIVHYSPPVFTPPSQLGFCVLPLQSFPCPHFSLSCFLFDLNIGIRKELQHVLLTKSTNILESVPTYFVLSSLQ